MNFNYINYSGDLSFIYLNGLFLKFFFNLNFLYNFFIYYNSYYRFVVSSQKNKSFVNFSNKKIYKQKGTGKARAGSLSSPLRVKGGKTFPNLYYINYKLNFNKLSYIISYFILYSNLIINNNFYIIEDFFFLEVKTKLIKHLFKDFNSLKIILLSIKIEKNFFLSLINFKFLKLYYFFNFNPLIFLKYSNLFISKSCLNFIFND